MAEFKRYIAVVVGLVLAAIGWLERSAPPFAMADIDTPLPVIGREFMQVMDIEREVPEFPERFLLLEPVERYEAPDRPGEIGIDPNDPRFNPPLPPEEPADPGFVLQLESVVAFADGSGQARINGVTVKVGSPIPGTDPENPAVLAALLGTSALIMFEDQPLLMDVYRIPQLRVGGEESDGEGGAPERPSGEQP